LHLGTAVKKTAFVVLAIALLAFGCKGRNGSSRNSTQTQTIAPAAAAVVRNLKRSEV